jgi:hypothetical protein
VRKYGSGREIPRYVIRTELGEVDFGLCSSVVETDEEGRVLVKLLPYDLKYFQSLDPNFTLPSQVKKDKDGRPIIPVRGVTG